MNEKELENSLDKYLVTATDEMEQKRMLAEALIMVGDIERIFEDYKNAPSRLKDEYPLLGAHFIADYCIGLAHDFFIKEIEGFCVFPESMVSGRLQKSRESARFQKLKDL